MGVAAAAGVAERLSGGVAVLFLAMCSTRAAARAGSFRFLSMTTVQTGFAADGIWEKEVEYLESESESVRERAWENSTTICRSDENRAPFPAAINASERMTQAGLGRSLGSAAESVSCRGRV